MKKVLVLCGSIFVAAGVVGFTTTAASDYLAKAKPGQADTGACQGKPYQTHTLIIEADKPSAGHIDARRCDVLTITNRDERLRNMSFGVHNQHQAYNGVTQKILAKDQSFSITLTETGSFIVHDHQQETVGSTFIVLN